MPRDDKERSRGCKRFHSLTRIYATLATPLNPNIRSFYEGITVSNMSGTLINHSAGTVDACFFFSFFGAQCKRRLAMVSSFEMKISTHQSKLYDVDTI